MTLRTLGAIGLLVAAMSGTARAQCATLGTPGLTGCQSPYPGSTAPTIACHGVPSITNAQTVSGNFEIYGTNLYGHHPVTSRLVLGFCSPTPLPIIPAPGAGVPLCPAAPLGCWGYIEPSGVLGLLAPAPSAVNLWGLYLPNDPNLIGAVLCAQWRGSATQGFLNSCGFLVSNGLQITILP